MRLGAALSPKGVTALEQEGQPAAGAVLTELLSEPGRRLGKNGVDEVLSHAFFDGFDRAGLRTKSIAPPSRPGDKMDKRFATAPAFDEESSPLSDKTLFSPYEGSQDLFAGF